MAEPTSNTVGTRELKARLSEYVSEVQFQSRHIKVTRNGKLAAVLVPVDWYVAAGVALRGDEHPYDDAWYANEVRARDERDRQHKAEAQRRASSESAD